MICDNELLNHFDEYELVHKIALNIHYSVNEHLILFDECPFVHKNALNMHFLIS